MVNWFKGLVSRLDSHSSTDATNTDQSHGIQPTRNHLQHKLNKYWYT